MPRITLDHEHTYPFFYHYLLAAFPDRASFWFERYSGALLDTLSLLIICLFMALIKDSAAPDDAENGKLLLVAALFSFSPALLRIGSGPRAYNGSPRPLGQMLFLLHILSAHYGIATLSTPALIVSILAGAAVIIAAKFSTQVLVFFTPFFGLLISPWYPALTGLSILAAIILSNGRAWRVLIGQYRHSVFYLKYLQQVFIHPGVRSFRDYINSVGHNLHKVLSLRELKPALAWYFTESHPLHLFVTVFSPFMMMPVIAIGYPDLSITEQFMLVWTLAAFFWFVITKTKPLMFLGEGERYLEYATFPTIYLAVSAWQTKHPLLIYGFLFYSLVAAAFYLFLYHRQFSASESAVNDAKRAFDILGSMNPGVIMPIGSFHWQTLFRSRFPVLTIGVNMDEKTLKADVFHLIYGNYPYPSADFRRILAQYDVSYVVSDQQHIKHYTDNILKNPDLFTQHTRLLFESSNISIYAVIRQV